jgi:soluble lytic murein transglycosylase
MLNKFGAAQLNLLRIAFAVVVLLIVSLPQIASAVPTRPQPPQNVTPVERDFLAARDAFERRDLNALAAAKDRFASRKDFAPAPYVTFWWLSTTVQANPLAAQTLQKAIQRMVDLYPATPIADGLLRDALRATGRTDAWQVFAAMETSYSGDDAEVSCHRLRNGLRAQSDADAVAKWNANAKELFLSNRVLPESCLDLFVKLRASRALSGDDVWQRVRVMLETGQLADARRTATLVPNLPAMFEPATASANLDAKKYLAKLPSKLADRAETEVALFAVSKLARADAAETAAWLDKNEARFKKSDAQYAWAQVGYFGALQLESDALNWFQRAGNVELNDTQAAWLAR